MNEEELSEAVKNLSMALTDRVLSDVAVKSFVAELKRRVGDERAGKIIAPRLMLLTVTAMKTALGVLSGKMPAEQASSYVDRMAMEFLGLAPAQADPDPK